MIVLAVNVGSTSLKLKVFDMSRDAVGGTGSFEGQGESVPNGLRTAAERLLASGRVERIGEEVCPVRLTAGGATRSSELRHADHQAAIGALIALLTEGRGRVLDGLDAIDAVGFKAVHAGERSGTFLVDEELLETMQEYAGAAPGHNPAYIRAMRAFGDLLPGRPLAAAFETAFHSGMPDYAATYSSPYEWYERHGIRRYGFHGASLRYVSERAAQLLRETGARRTAGDPNDLRLVACHLGGSSSICAVQGGRSIDTSMGFTPQAGVPMNNRCGDIDPFILPFVQQREGLTASELARELAENAGLKGISGLSGDVRDLEAASDRGHSRAELALNVFAYSVKKHIGAYSAALGGLDVLAFSGGIGERSPGIRGRVCRGLEFLGVTLDERRNADCTGEGQGREAVISREGAPVPVYVIPTDEEIIVARETVRLLRGLHARPGPDTRGDEHQ